MDIFETLTQLNAAFGPSGEEGGVAQVIAGLARPFADEISSDPLGNLIVHRRGEGPRLLFAAHMDSLGLMVTRIEEEGFLRVAKLGGIHPERVLHTPVRFQNGTVGVLCADGGAALDKLKLEDLYIDIGASSRQEAEALVQVGDVAVYHTPVLRAGEKVISPYLDNRISCAILLQALEALQEPRFDCYFVFTAQEEVGCRGARTAAWTIDPQYAVAVDVCGSGDTPGGKNSSGSSQGKGASIKVMDHSVICHPAMVKALKGLALERDIPWQLDVAGTGGTDAGPMHQSRAGVITGGICIPCRYTHTPGEMVDLRDVDACLRLVTALAEAGPGRLSE